MVKFGHPIGAAAVDIPRGAVVHLTHVVPDSRYNIIEIMSGGFVLGEALRPIARGDVVRAGVNVRVRHPALRDLGEGARIGFAASSVPAGETVWIGNLVELPRRLGWNVKYRNLVRDFYRFLFTGLETFSRV